MRNDYRTRVKQMSDEDLLKYIDRLWDKTMIDASEWNRYCYAETLAKKRGLLPEAKATE